MIPSERHHLILNLAAERGTISINELAEQLDVSHMTIRRDIQKLEQKGMIIAVSGGVQSLQRLAFEPSHQDKATMFGEQKELIGRLAAQIIPPNATVYLDAGTTTLAIAKNIVHREDLLVITNDFVIANYLMEFSYCKLIHTGGIVCRANRSCVGEFAALALKNLFIDVAFISASSWSLRGLTTPSEDKVAVKKAIVESSAKRVLVCDSSKYGKVGTFLAIPITVFDSIITDANLPTTAQDAIAEHNIRLILPNTNSPDSP